MSNDDLIIVGAVIVGAIVVIRMARTFFRVILFQVVARMLTGPGLALLLPTLGLSGAMFMGGDETPAPDSFSNHAFAESASHIKDVTSKAASSGVAGRIKSSSCGLVLDALDAMSEVSVISGPANSIHRSATKVCRD